MRVQAGALDGKLLIEYYDTSYNFKRAMTLDLSLPIFGAFYESNDNYYILTGQNNPDHNDSVETYRVTKYSKDWKAQGSCKYCPAICIRNSQNDGIRKLPLCQNLSCYV